MDINGVLLNRKKDNVVVVTRPMKAGEYVVFQAEDGLERLMLSEDIPVFHKAARCDIEKDGNVVKYGEPIGAALCSITCGQYVHIHNTASRKDPRRKEMENRWNS